MANLSTKIGSETESAKHPYFGTNKTVSRRMRLNEEKGTIGSFSAFGMVGPDNHFDSHVPCMGVPAEVGARPKHHPGIRDRCQSRPFHLDCRFLGIRLLYPFRFSEFYRAKKDLQVKIVKLVYQLSMGTCRLREVLHDSISCCLYARVLSDSVRSDSAAVWVVYITSTQESCKRLR